MPKTPIFISGIGRSGTSAVIKSIAEHSEVVTPDRIGEAPFVSGFVNFLRDYEDVSAARDYNQKNYQLNEDDRKLEFSRLLAMIQYGKDISSDDIKGRYWIAKVSFSEQLFEKARAVLGDAKVIYVMRNGIEVVNSAKSFHGFANLTFEQLCTRWVDNIEQCKYVHTNNNCAVVKHHELVNDPHTVYQSVFEKLGIAIDEAPANFISTNLFNSSFDETSESESTAGVFNERLKCWGDWTDWEKDTFITLCDEKMKEYNFERPYATFNADKAQIESKDKKASNDPVNNVVRINSATKESENTPPSRDKTSELSSIHELIQNSMRSPQFDYFANYSIKHGYFFMENPKVASTTLLKQFQIAEVGTSSPLPENNPHDRDASPIPRLSTYSAEEQWNAFFSSEIFRFTFVRNPYSRLLSAYLSKIDKPLRAKKEILSVINGVDKSEVIDLTQRVSFEEFVDVVCAQSAKDMNVHWKPQIDQVLHGKIDYDFVGRFESLAQDFDYLSKKMFGTENLVLSHSANKTSSSSKIDSFYNDDLRKKVQSRFECDFEAFEYSTNIGKVLDRKNTDTVKSRVIV